MSRKLKSIEFFGLSGSGKSYIASILKKNLEKKGFTVFNARECVTKGSKDYIKTSLIEKIALNYFKLINFKNLKKKNIKNLQKKSNFIKNKNINANYFKIIYLEICKRISKKNRKFNIVIKQLEKILSSSSRKETQYLFWFYELIASHIIFKKIFKSSKYILLLDEGLIQRSFIINNRIPKKQRNKFLNLYFSRLPISKLIFYISNNKNSLMKINKLRKKFQIQKFKDQKELKNNSKFLKSYLLPNKRFKFEKIENDKNIEKIILNFFN